mgnify:CR=1 FL=1
MIINLKKLKRKDLLSLPHRHWNEESTYDFLLLTANGSKHDSGYSLIAIIGCRYLDKDITAEIAATCDDVCWSMPTKHPYDQIERGKHKMIMRSDCLYPSGIMRIWGSGEHYFSGKFKVGVSLSSTEVELIVVPKGDGVNKVTGEKING